MDVNKPISGEFAALIPMLADTMKFATQALAESSALAELLIEKGVVTKAELDKRMSVGQSMPITSTEKFWFTRTWLSTGSPNSACLFGSTLRLRM